jgi:hypothetical protein
MIPLFGCLAHGGKIVQLDDDSVVKDLAAADGTGGAAFNAFLLSNPFDGGNEGGYSRLRKLVQTIEHEGAVTVNVTPYRDGSETGQTISRTLAASGNPIVTAPLAVGATRFQVKVMVSAFDALVELGKAQFWVVARRSER